MSLDSWITGEGKCSYCGQFSCQCQPDQEEPEEKPIPCPKCGGSGTCYEGWDCWYCDGEGYIEL